MNPIIDVHQSNGVLVTTSRNIAEVFGKEHYNVLKDVKSLIEEAPDKNFTAVNFYVSEYTDSTGRKLPEYLLTRDGTMLLVMGYNGTKALELKTAYIKCFNEMEQRLKNLQLEEEKKDIPLTEIIQATAILLKEADIEKNQLVLALDKVAKAETGRSLLTMAQVKLVADTQNQLYTPTQLGKEIGISAVKFNKALAFADLQVKVEDKWEMTPKGKSKGGIYLDTNKKHSDGTPVRQLKWPYEIINDVKRVLEEIDS